MSHPKPWYINRGQSIAKWLILKDSDCPISLFKTTSDNMVGYSVLGLTF
jgi:hypothetical protein